MGFNCCGPRDDQTADFQLICTTVDSELLAVEKNVKHVFAHTRNGGVLVVNTSNAHCGDCCALEVAHEHPSEGVPESRCLTTLEWADEKNTGLRAIICDLMLDTVPMVLQHGLKR